MLVQEVSLHKAGYACEFSKSCPAILCNTPACMFCSKFSSSVHALSQPHSLRQI